MSVRLVRALFVAIAALASLAGANPAQAAPKLTQQEIQALVDAHYDEEIKRLKLIIESRKQDAVVYLTGLTREEAKKALANKNEIAPILPKTPPVADPCEAPQRIFIRRNGQDTFQLGAVDVPVANAKGASASVTQDNLTHSNVVSINGRLQTVVARQHPLTRCADGKTIAAELPSTTLTQFGYMIAPFVDGQGATNNPRRNGESSSLQLGVDLQLAALGGPFINSQYLTLSPYYQTDFRGNANVQGAKAAWDFIEPEINLGGSRGVPNSYFDWFWQLRAEYDAKHVTDPGLTGLARSNYQWVGGSVQAHFTLFPSFEKIQPSKESLFPAIANRIFINAMANYYRDTNSGRDINLYEAELGYNLSDDGKSSVSIKYDSGTDKDTLQLMKKYLVGLNFKY